MRSHVTRHLIRSQTVCKDCTDARKILDTYKTSCSTEDCRWAWVCYDTFKEGTDVTDFEWKKIEEEPTNELINTGKTCETHDQKDMIGKSLKNATERLHSAADHLPAMGTVLEVYLWPPDADNGSYIPLLGSLRRLKDWHNAKVTIFDRELGPATEFLHRFLSSEICISVEDFVPSSNDVVFWRGKVSICDKIENSCVLIPGVSVCKTDKSHPDLKFPQRPVHSLETHQGSDIVQPGRMLEVLDEVTLTAVPAYLKTPYQYKLCFYQKHSYCQVLMSYLQENSTMGLLARLAVYPEMKTDLTCADIGLSTEAWKESISADIQFAQEPEEELQDNYEFLYFLITSPRITSPDKFVATIHLLQHPYSVDSSIMSVIYHQAMLPVDRDVEDFDLSGLPILCDDVLRGVLTDLQDLQQHMIQNWIVEKKQSGTSTLVSVEELTGFLGNVCTKYLQKLAVKCPVVKNSKPELSIRLNKENTDLLEKNFDWPERLIQQYLESHKRSLSRIQSSESVPLSSPIQPNGVATTIDIEKFLKFFHPDGSASTNLSPVRRRHPNRSHLRNVLPDNTSPQKIAWPDSKDIAAHDMYYNLDKKSEKINNHLNRLQEKYVKDETYSSCRSNVVVFPNCSKRKQTQTCLELRRSPRKRAAPSSWHDDREETKRQKVQGERLSKIITPLATIQERDSKRRLSLPAFSQTQRRISIGTPQERRSESGNTITAGIPAQVKKLRRESDIGVSGSSSHGQDSKKESRSERHKRKLMDIVESVLLEHGLDKSEPIFEPCSSRLYKVTKLFVMDLPTSRNLKAEMRKIAESQAKQVIEVGKNRLSSSQGARHKKKSL